MPSFVYRKADLRTVEPVQVNSRAVFAVGTIIWAIVTLIVLALRLFTDVETGRMLWVCIAGFVMGIVSVGDMYRRARPGYKGNK